MHSDVTIGLLALLGGLGTYLLLPKQPWVRRDAGGGRLASLRRGLDRWDDLLHDPRARWVGAALALLALLCALTLFRAADPFVSRAAFFLFSILAIGSGVMMIASRAPVYSALWFALVVLSSSGLYLLQGGQFLAAATVIIYAGAIIVTFLFVIMLAQQEGIDRADRRSREPFMASLCGSVLLWCLLYAGIATFRGPADRRVQPEPATNVLWTEDAHGHPRRNEEHALYSSYRSAVPLSAEMPRPSENVDSVGALGGTIFRDHLVSLEVAGTILLAALIGAIAIATPRKAEPLGSASRQPEYGPRTPDFNLGERPAP